MNIKLPLMLDTSHYETIFDFAQVSPRPLLVITKATEGASLVDPKFAAYWADLKQDRINRGAYHFFRKAAAIAAQAALFIKTVKAGGVQPSDIFVLDVEETGVSAAQIIAWITAVEAEYGNQIVIYSRKNILDPIAVTTTQAQRLKRYPVWTAGYPLYPDNFNAPPPAYIPDPSKWGEVWMWQYSEKAIVPGISGDVDVNWMSPALIAKLTPAPTVPDNNDILARLDDLAALINARAAEILAKIGNGTPQNPPEPPPAVDYTGTATLYKLQDAAGQPRVKIGDSFTAEAAIALRTDEMVSYVKALSPDNWAKLSAAGVLTQKANGTWQIATRGVNGRAVKIAQIAKGRGRIVSFSPTADPAVNYKLDYNVAKVNPATYPFLFMVLANGGIIPLFEPFDVTGTDNQYWVAMEDTVRV